MLIIFVSSRYIATLLWMDEMHNTTAICVAKTFTETMNRDLKKCGLDSM